MDQFVKCFIFAWVSSPGDSHEQDVTTLSFTEPAVLIMELALQQAASYMA